MRTALRMAALVLAALLLLPGASAASDEDRFEEARQLAFSGERDAARNVLTALLGTKPDHWDARILLGRTLAWDGNYDEARAQIAIVLSRRPGHKDARAALIDIEMWSDNPASALDLVEEGLAADPNNEDFLLKKAQAQRKLDDLSGAAVTLDRLLQVNPAHTQGNELLSSLRVARARSKVGVSYGLTENDAFGEAWHDASFQLSHRTAIGTVAARVNYARRFGDTAQQYEVDAYPRIANGLYMYVNYGYSAQGFYPRHRYGAELYANLAGGVELSAGFRRLEFSSTDVTMYTGTVAKYLGNWWVSFRPYITPKEEGTSRSYSLSVRRYFGNADSYIGLVGGIGSSPADIVDVTDLARLDSWKVGLRGQAPIGDMFIVKYSAGYGWEEWLGTDRREATFGLGFERRF